MIVLLTILIPHDAPHSLHNSHFTLCGVTIRILVLNIMANWSHINLVVNVRGVCYCEGCVTVVRGVLLL